MGRTLAHKLQPGICRENMNHTMYKNRREWLKENIKFFGMYLRDPITVGAWFPSSRDLTQAMIDQGGNLDDCKLIVELGVGTGVLTTHLAEVLQPQHDFFAIELNPVFAEKVRAVVPHLAIYEDSAAHIDDYLVKHEADAVDVMFSGIPWANLPESVQVELLHSLHDALKPGGYFITFAYIHSYYFISSIRFRELLRDQFPDFHVSPIIWRNFPPAVIYICRRAEE